MWQLSQDLQAALAVKFEAEGSSQVKPRAKPERLSKEFFRVDSSETEDTDANVVNTLIRYFIAKKMSPQDATKRAEMEMTRLLK